jgi:hypothetical protein
MAEFGDSDGDDEEGHEAGTRIALGLLEEH